MSVGSTLSQGAYGTINLNSGGTLQIGTGGTTGVLGVSTLTNKGRTLLKKLHKALKNSSIEKELPDFLRYEGFNTGSRMRPKPRPKGPRGAGPDAIAWRKAGPVSVHLRTCKDAAARLDPVSLSQPSSPTVPSCRTNYRAVGIRQPRR